MSNDKKDPRERLEAEVLSLLREKFYLRENGDGTFSQKIYADYRDEMEDKTAAEICESDDPRQTFYEKMYEWYDDYAYQLRCDLQNELEKELETAYPDGLSEEERTALEKILIETVYYDYPEEHYLRQEFCVTIMTDTGDANYDFVLNSEYLCCQGKRGERIDRRAGIAWLARSQGYSKTQAGGFEAGRHGQAERLSGEYARGACQPSVAHEYGYISGEDDAGTVNERQRGASQIRAQNAPPPYG